MSNKYLHWFQGNCCSGYPNCIHNPSEIEQARIRACEDASFLAKENEDLKAKLKIAEDALPKLLEIIHIQGEALKEVRSNLIEEGYQEINYNIMIIDDTLTSIEEICGEVEG